MKPKSIAVMLLEKKHKADTGDDEDGAEEPSMPPLEEVMREFIDAVKSDDARGAAKAFRGALACSEGYDDSEDDEE